ncbi:hypothetical protein CYFUS_001609 [Cystobacter fuscus]|uniref:Uncharacterized protein n=1 Tax=Cystobacter fuscus TaxID=43 RepID=A0A250IWT7_9BACT|nr:hypothetical protein [Cystobacter fuscus]ATB36195.1 hypothetical protein CYFUS_001609 [Cystobacter fuscus]
MSQTTPNSSALPIEPPELVARREQLLATLEKEAKVATGTAEPVLRKMHELLASTQPGAPFDPALYEGVRSAFVSFTQAPVFPPPAILMECLAFLQERQVAFMTASQG